MKYLFAIKSLNVVGGGAEKVLVTIVNGLKDRGHTLGVLTFDFAGEAFYNLDPGIARFDMAFNPPGQPTSPGKFVKAIPRIRSAVRAFKPDVFVPFMHSTFVPLKLATIGMGIKTVYSEHIDYSHYVESPKQYRLLKMAKRSAMATTVPSMAAKESFPVEDRRGMVVIPNSVQKMHFPKDARSSSVKGPVALAVGRLMSQKDFGVLIDSFSMLADEFPGWTLRIVGEGQLRDELEAKIAALGLQERISLPGSTRDVSSEYARAIFVVVPSHYESFGLVAAEALMSSRPVLSFEECLGVSELVQEGINGILVQGGQTHESRREALASGLRRLMSDRELCSQLGKAGPESVSQYDLESVLDKWEALLSSLPT